MQGGYYDTPRIPVFDQRQHSGQGGAFRQVGPTKVAVFTVVNALGVVVDRQGRVVRCSTNPAVRDCGTAAAQLTRTLERRAPAGPSSGGFTENTTLTLVVTNQKLDFWALQRLAVQVHTSMARAIQPFHTQQDGDVLFAVSTAEVENPSLSPVNLGVLASEVAWDAVLSSVPPLSPADTTIIHVDPRVYNAYVGRYEFGPEAVLTVTREGGRLFVQATAKRAVYGFAPNEKLEVFPTSPENLLSRNVRGDRLRFVRDRRNRVTGLLLNPGSWALPARRLP
jgi:hypothetical protein